MLIIVMCEPREKEKARDWAGAARMKRSEDAGECACKRTAGFGLGARVRMRTRKG
jgi:hypothetical protein